jgi:hypothetical protein
MHRESKGEIVTKPIIEQGARFTLSGRGDLGIEREKRPYVGQQVTAVKVTKSGLVLVRTDDGKEFPVPAANLDAA